MKKLLTTLVICAAFLQGGCATIANTHKVPSNISESQLQKASDLGLVEYRWRYFIPNILTIPLFGIGIAANVIDIVTNAPYYVTDQQTFNKWYSQILKEQQAEKQKIMEDKN